MKINGDALLGQRAERLAIIHLSRRDDLNVTQSQDEYGIDLLVNLIKAGKTTGRVFGVLVKATRSLPIKGAGSEGEQIKLQISSSKIPEDLPFPLALFVFNMEDDQGYFRWLLSPVLTSANVSRLSVNHDSTFTRISTTTIDQIVAQVNQWYELRHQESMNGKAEMVHA